MRIHFKTDYEHDIRLFEDRREVVQYALLILAAITAPWWLDEYMLGEVTYVLIWVLAGLGLMVLAGHTGQASLGHGAFLACGAYMEVILLEAGVPFPLSFLGAGLFAGIVGAIVAIPALKMSGIYLAIATLAFGIMTEDIIILLEHWTGGVEGVFTPTIYLFGLEIDRWGTPDYFYWLCLITVIIVTLLYKNILRSPTGRAFTAIRDSEISARAMGVNVAAMKTLAFGISCFFTGLAGALLAHFLQAFNYEAFLILISIQLLLMVVVGGLGSIHGAYFGAIVIGLLPVVISILREEVAAILGTGNTAIPGLETGIFAAILIGFIIIEPLGIYGRWTKIRIWLELFPMARKDMFRRQKSYLKTERMR
ncbi:MAG: branched-chain amino acid ABC transporter permease [Pseudomonadota bacterium]